MNSDSAAAELPNGKSFGPFLPQVARVLMGLGFLVFGLNGFFDFLPKPRDPMPEAVLGLFGAMIKTGYMLPLISGTQVVVGVLLLLNRFVPLALALIAPELVNIFLLHLFIERSGLPIAIVFCALEVYLAWAYRDAFRGMLAAKVRPAAAR